MPSYVPDKAMRNFWEAEVMPIFSLLIGNNYRLPTIQARYSWLTSTVVNRYQRTINVAISDVLPKDDAGKDRRISFGASLRDGNKPEVSIFIPSLKSLFEELRQSSPKDFRRLFEYTIVISYLHELEHLAFGRLASQEDFSVETLIETERLTWAETCDFTIRLFIELGEPICGSDWYFYSAWLECGRNVDGDRWKEFIKKVYGSVKKNRP